MPDESRGCPQCEGLVVMVAVACSRCGELHHSGYGGRPAGAGPSSAGEGRTVWDVPAELADAPITAHPGSGALAVPVRPPDRLHVSTPPRIRTSAIYTNGNHTNGGHMNGGHMNGGHMNGDGRPPPKALPVGRRPLPPAPPPRVPRERLGGARTESARARRPLVQMIQDVLNRGAARHLEPGTCVVVRNQFNGRWTPGFVVHEVLDAGYRIRRDHTGAVLPTIFVRSDVAGDGTGRTVSARRPDRAEACASV